MNAALVPLTAAVGFVGYEVPVRSCWIDRSCHADEIGLFMGPLDSASSSEYAKADKLCVIKSRIRQSDYLFRISALQVDTKVGSLLLGPTSTRTPNSFLSTVP